jgi:hypothetical protein
MHASRSDEPPGHAPERRTGDDDLRLTVADIAALLDALAAHVQAPQVVGVRELAQILGVDPATIYRRADELGASRIGSALRFDVNEALGRTRRGALDAPSKASAPRRKRRRATRSSAPLLEIHGDRA